VSEVDAMLRGSPYQQYVYGYPHKTAYRPLAEPVALADLWAREDRAALSLYAHVPFCEVRCGFCNLFTEARPDDAPVRAWLGAFERQCRAVSRALGTRRFARAALGGGTPTWLDPDDLARVLALMEEVLEQPIAAVPTSVETSPATATPERVAMLRERGVFRVSVGVQSFDDAECRAMGRPQRPDDVRRALEILRDARFPVLNVDLIYGAAGQTEESLARSLDAALGYAPQELYLYPLYVRPLTGLDRRARSWDDHRIALYRSARDHLRARGWRQGSMRMFRAPDAPVAPGPGYECQRDGMVGLGCGARSYTRALHYSEPWAVRAASVREILADYAALDDRALAHARHGVALDEPEQRRRHVLLSLLGEGMALDDFARRFGVDVFVEVPALAALCDAGLAEMRGGVLALTDRGVERSDAVGPMLFTAAMRDRMGGFELR
jgi:oxygen-independent coproporphyrinogen-3 oxidase